MSDQRIGTRAERLAARRERLEAEKQHMRRGDEQNPGCTGCSFVADRFAGVIHHLNGRDVTLVAESIAPLAGRHAYAKRMGRRTIVESGS
jgi:predicted dithiol-disulfide oxidoreductase (DUF899 family)